jgi:hypothetical protein
MKGRFVDRPASPYNPRLVVAAAKRALKYNIQAQVQAASARSQCRARGPCAYCASVYH